MDNTSTSNVTAIAEDLDLLHGAAEIAAFLYPDDPSGLRKVYRLTSEVEPEHRLPVFKLGPFKLTARKSTLRAYIKKREAENNVRIVQPTKQSNNKTEAVRGRRSKHGALELALS